MLNFTKKPSRKYSHRLVILILICAGLVAQVLFTRDARVQEPGKEPIAYIGHGAMFDQNGNEITPSLTFIQEAQAWYRAELARKLSRTQRAQFNQFQRGLIRGLVLDKQSQLVLNTHLIDWLLNAVKVPNADRIRGKNNLMKLLLKTKLPERAGSAPPQKTEPFNVNPELLKRLTTKGQAKGPVTRTLTGSGGAAYRAECLAAGVPIPPDFGPGSAWVSRGLIPQSSLFIVAGLGAEVLTYQSTSPEGMCVALPRFNTTTNLVELDGVICLGKTTSKVCFWDNEKNGTAFTFTRGDAVPFNNFGGGTELLASAGGVCSDCHAGENPYIIHPDPSTVLGGLAGLGLPTFGTNWHNPIVRTGDTQPWPENPGPINAPASCAGCHTQGVAGRFPQLSTALDGYCKTILKQAITRTMPPSAPGSLANTQEVKDFQALCNNPPQDPILAATGKLTLLRVHDLGTGFGPPTDFIDVEVVIGLDSQPGKFFGFQLRNDANRNAHRDMLNRLRDAFKNNRTVTIDYRSKAGKTNFVLFRVYLSK